MYNDDNYWWRVDVALVVNMQKDEAPKGTIHEADVVTFTSILSKTKLKSSKDFKAPSTQQQEVSCGKYSKTANQPVENNDGNNRWEVKVLGNDSKAWRKGTIVELKHLSSKN